MKTTKADSFAVDSVACRTRSQLSRRLAAPRMSAPVAPIAPPSVGVAMPRKIVPSTRKIRNSGGTITNVVCCAIAERKRNPVSLSMIQFSTATKNANRMPLNMVSTTKSAPCVSDFLITNHPNTALASVSTPSEASGVFGWFVMRKSETHGADFVVLTIFNGILFAFFVAVLNWIVDKLTGFRFLSAMAQQTTFVMVPPLFLIFLVLGTIFIGIATPTEGGAMGATGALILGAAKRRLSWDLVRQATESTAKLSAFVVFILVGARVFSLTFYGVNGHVWVEHLLTSLPGGQIGFLIFVNAFVFVLAFFLDFFELAFIVIPLLGPAAEHLGIDLILFGVILGVNMQTSFMHPPFGFALFYLRSVAPKDSYIDRVTGKRMDPVTTGQIYWGAVPFVVIQVIMVLLVIMFPAMVMHYKGALSTIDPNTIKIDIPQIELPPLDFGPPPKQ